MAETDTSTVEDRRVAAMEENMRAQGVNPYERTPADYFGVDAEETVVLPDEVSFVSIRTLNEGHRRKYLNEVNRDVRFHRATGDAVMRMAPGDEKQTLLKLAITGWNLHRGGQPIPFSPLNLDAFLTTAPPKVIDLIDKRVRKMNDWLMADVTAEDIRAEIADLQEQLAKLEAEEEGKAAS